EGLLQPHGPASVHWKGARRGTRTLRRAAGPPQGGLTEVRPRAPCPLGPAPPSGYSAFATLAGFVSATARLRVRTRERVTARFEGPRYSRQAVRTRRRGDRINLLQCKCRHIAVVRACPPSAATSASLRQVLGKTNVTHDARENGDELCLLDPHAGCLRLRRAGAGAPQIAAPPWRRGRASGAHGVLAERMD